MPTTANTELKELYKRKGKGKGKGSEGNSKSDLRPSFGTL